MANKDVLAAGTFQQSSEAIATLIKNAHLTVNIYSPRLTPRIFDQPLVVSACQTFALTRPQNKISLLIDDASYLHRTGHGLLRLSNLCSSRVFIKRLNPVIEGRDDEFVCLDKRGYYHRPNTRHLEAHYCRHDSRKTSLFLAFFNDAWERSAPDPELRSMLL